MLFLSKSMLFLENYLLERYIEIVGIIAGVGTILSFVPQVTRIYKLRNTEAISLPMYIMFSIAEIFWILYGWMIHANAIIYTNIIILLLALIILIMKIIWG